MRITDSLVPDDQVRGDGLHARANGGWAEAKTYFLEQYARVALDATAKKRTRMYIDLFAGPGAWREKPSARFHYGSPIRALQLRGAQTGCAFTHAVFVNKERDDHELLQERIALLRADGRISLPPDRIWLIHGDSVDCLPSILESLHPRGYALVYADIENPTQWPWEAVTSVRAHGHQSLDFLMLFPLHMAINRMLPRTNPVSEAWAKQLTRFFGTDAWQAYISPNMRKHERVTMRAQLTELYLGQLRTLWAYSRHVLDVRRTRNQFLYQLLFASDATVADSIAAWASVRPADGQVDLFRR